MLIKNLIINSDYNSVAVPYLTYVLLNIIMFSSFTIYVWYSQFSNKFVTINCPEPSNNILVNFFIIRPQIKAFYAVYNYHNNKKISLKLILKILKVVLTVGTLIDIINFIIFCFKNKHLSLNLCFNELWPYSDDKKIIIRDYKIIRNGLAWRLCKPNYHAYNKVNENIISNSNVNFMGIRAKGSLAHPGVTHNFTNLGGWAGTSKKYIKHSFKSFINSQSTEINLYFLKFERLLYDNKVLFKSTVGNNDTYVIIPFKELSIKLQNTLTSSGGLMLIEPHLSLLHGLDSNFVYPDVFKGRFAVVNLGNDPEILIKAKRVIEDIGGIDLCYGYYNHWNYVVNLYHRSMDILVQANFCKNNNIKLSDLDKRKIESIRDELIIYKINTEDCNILFNHDMFIDQFNNFLN